jgi:hypothetical protein
VSQEVIVLTKKNCVHFKEFLLVNTHMSFSGEALPSFVSKLCDVFVVPFLEQLIRYTRNNHERRTLKDLMQYILYNSV